jgi:hypothetical protein
MKADIAGDTETRGPADPRADRLNHDHQGIGENERPSKPETKLRSGLAVGGNSAGIIVRGARDETGP